MPLNEAHQLNWIHDLYRLGQADLLQTSPEDILGLFNQKNDLYLITSVNLGIPSLQPKDRLQSLPSAC